MTQSNNQPYIPRHTAAPKYDGSIPTCDEPLRYLYTHPSMQISPFYITLFCIKDFDHIHSHDPNLMDQQHYCIGPEGDAVFWKEVSNEDATNG